MMITAREVTAIARETGFRLEIVEKVLRLVGILDRIDCHDQLAGAWLLKGGTALNLLHLEVPRLSVDIDLNYVGFSDVEAMREARPVFERALTSCCEREGCTVRRAPTEHAGGKYRLRYTSVFGGAQNLEVDINYVSRIPLWGSRRIKVRFPPGLDLEVPTLRLEELAAGKFAALVDRTAARDAFDAARLLELAPDLVERPRFRIAFLCFLAGVRKDARRFEAEGSLLSPLIIKRDLEPLLRRGSGPETGRPIDVAEWIHRTVSPILEELLTWSTNETRFLDKLLDEGVIEADLLSKETDIQDRIREQPMLKWKAQNVRAFRARKKV